MGSFFSLGKSSNDTQENSKDAQKSTSFQEKYTKPTETTELVEKNKNLTADKEKLNNQLIASQKQVKDLQDSKQVLENVKTELSKEKENLTKANAELKTENDKLNQTSQKLNELEQRHAPYQKLEKLYEVFLEVKDRLNFNFVATTHSAMDLIASVLSDSKYYLESLYNKASQELSDKRSDKGEKLAELFDLLFEYIKDSKFERLKEPSAYDHSCKTLYPEQNSSQKMQRVVLRGYTYDKKIACYTIVDMGS
ncbi:M protein [Helicobacter pylori]|uniref:M protein n=1 Tax=Helicobacter pylori TaxID=210 RepID=UPI0013F48856|nr:M protein [Helicobacter pylori]WQV82555.1 M protein [Helicobacter pylori]WQV91360.1 M protein [Helicobacter pylori]